jgi:hypothetical protein
MISENLLPFKLGKTEEVISAMSGLSLFGEFALSIGLKEEVKRNFEPPGSGRGFDAYEYVFSMLLMLQSGGEHLEDIKKISEDVGLRKVLNLKRVPTSDANGDWLRRKGLKGVEGIERVNNAFLRRILKRDGIKGYTLDIDATGIEAEKREAKMTYKGFKGYMPIIGHLAENGFILAFEFREGNESPGSRNLEFYRKCKEFLPKKKKIKYFRADSASYQAKLMDELEEDGVKYAIGGDLDAAVREVIRSVRDKDYVKYREGEVSEGIHIFNKGKYPFRLIIYRRYRERSLFEEDGYDYNVYATNFTNEEKSAAEVLNYYFHRGEDSENRIKELKLDFSMERLPCGQYEANALFFAIGCLSYNLFKMFVRAALPQSFWKSRVTTLRYHIYNVAGRIIETGRSLWLKVRKDSYELFEGIRRKIAINSG